METIVYPYRKTGAEIVAVLGGVFFALIGFSGACPVGMTFIVLVFNLLSGRELTLNSELGPTVTYLLVFGYGLMSLLIGAVGAYMVYSGVTPYEASLTPDTFIYGRRGYLKSFHLDEIVSVAGRTEMFGRGIPWGVTIKDVHNRNVWLLVGGGLARRITGHFDYQVILRDLLPRLPSTALINDEVRHFVETGKLP